MQQLPTGLRVLLAEDEPLIAMDGEAVLQSMGVQLVVLAYESGLVVPGAARG